MTLFEIFISAIFTASCGVIGYLTYQVSTNTIASLKTLSQDHSQTKKSVEEHDKEIRKHGLEILHSKEIATRTEAEFKNLLEQHGEKFDQVIELLREAMNMKIEKPHKR